MCVGDVDFEAALANVNEQDMLLQVRRRKLAESLAEAQAKYDALVSVK